MWSCWILHRQYARPSSSKITQGACYHWTSILTALVLNVRKDQGRAVVTSWTPGYMVFDTRGPRYQGPAVRRSSAVLPCTLRFPLPRRRDLHDGQRQVEIDETPLRTAAENHLELPWRQWRHHRRVTTTWRRVDAAMWTKYRPIFCSSDCCLSCYQWPSVTLTSSLFYSVLP